MKLLLKTNICWSTSLVPILPDGWQEDAPYLVKALEEQLGKIFIVHRLIRSPAA
jgi:hypothetical protein